MAPYNNAMQTDKGKLSRLLLAQKPRQLAFPLIASVMPTSKVVPMSAKKLSAFVMTVVAVAFTNGTVAQINEPLKNELLQMRETDQAGRMKIQEARREHGFDSPEVEALWEAQQKIDETNLRQLEEIVATYGWPGESLVGREAAMAAFLIIQHADHGTQLEYLPLVKRAVEDEELEGQALAMLQDRILVREGKKQIYGTQLRRDEGSGELELFSIKDRENVDARRAELGMRPLAEYLKMVREDSG